jgi:hypothetical protein
MLVTSLVANSTFDVWPPCIQVGTPCIFNLFIHRALVFHLVMNFLILMLRSNIWCGSSLLKLLHHIVKVILSRLHFSLLLQLVHFKFKPLDFTLQVIIFLHYCFITRLYKHLLNLRRMALVTKSVNINIITSFATFACRSFRSLEIT